MTPTQRAAREAESETIMKLVRFDGGRIGVLQDGKVYDATDAVGANPKAWPPTASSPAPTATADMLPST